MTSSPCFHQARRWAIAAALVTIASQPALAEAAPAPVRGDTSTPRVGRWRDELPIMFSRVAAVFDSGFAAWERDLVLRELGAIRPRENPSRYGPVPTKSYVVQVRFRGRTTGFNMFAYWADTSRVGFYIRSKDSVLTEAIDSTFRAARAALLAAPSGVRIHVEDPFVWNGAEQTTSVALWVEDPKHCQGFGVENHGEARGDTIAIHVVGVAPGDGCPYGTFPPQMSHRVLGAPGQHHIAIDFKGDTNRFTAHVTDSSLALTTLRSTFVTADERVRWRVPSGSFVLTCSHFHRGSDVICNSLQAWAARRPGVERITFDSVGVSPLRDHAEAYRYADDRTLASMRACIATLHPVIRHSNDVELQVRPRSGRWIVDRVASPADVPRIASDPSCGLPRSIADHGKTLTSYPLNCPTPSANARSFVADILQRNTDMRQWLGDQHIAVPTAETLDPLSAPRDVARCRHVDSTSVRHPVALFRLGPYFVATNLDGLDSLTLDGPVRGYLVWLLDSANNVLQVPQVVRVMPAVRGRVLDSLTGKPVSHVRLSVHGAPPIRTDSLGRYEFFNLPPGTHEISFTCPTTRAESERIVATRRIDLTSGAGNVVDFRVRFPNCKEPPLRTWSGEFSGYYSFGFEVSRAFTPCTPLESFAGTAYEGLRRSWALLTFSEPAEEQLASKWPRGDTPEPRAKPLFVRWRATVTGPGSYGRFGMARYLMRVTEVLEMRRAAPPDCKE